MRNCLLDSVVVSFTSPHVYENCMRQKEAAAIKTNVMNSIFPWKGFAHLLFLHYDCTDTRQIIRERIKATVAVKGKFHCSIELIICTQQRFPIWKWYQILEVNHLWCNCSKTQGCFKNILWNCFVRRLNCAQFRAEEIRHILMGI